MMLLLKHKQAAQRHGGSLYRIPLEQLSPVADAPLAHRFIIRLPAALGTVSILKGGLLCIEECMFFAGITSSGARFER